jgi:tRNA threonylcarbamoyladenosine biosynthesis protein TsaB
MEKNALAIETTGRALSVAVVTDGIVAERRSDKELSHLTDLVPTVRDLLASAGAELSSLGFIAVSAGPGSFTGIRIGISAARAMAQVTGLPVVKVPTLETFVYGYEPGAVVCPMLDARRGQVYCGAYRLSPQGGAIETLVPGGVRTEDEFDVGLDAALPTPGTVPVLRVRDEDEPQSAACVLKWAQAFGEPVGYEELEPIYMREAEAQRKLEERLAADAEGAG